jgi:hypothetical protein
MLLPAIALVLLVVGFLIDLAVRRGLEADARALEDRLARAAMTEGAWGALVLLPISDRELTRVERTLRDESAARSPEELMRILGGAAEKVISQRFLVSLPEADTQRWLAQVLGDLDREGIPIAPGDSPADAILCVALVGREPPPRSSDVRALIAHVRGCLGVGAVLCRAKRRTSRMRSAGPVLSVLCLIAAVILGVLGVERIVQRPPEVNTDALSEQDGGASLDVHRADGGATRTATRAGTPPSSGTDAGVVARDGGKDRPDAGKAHADAGKAHPDAGKAHPDAGKHASTAHRDGGQAKD